MTSSAVPVLPARSQPGIAAPEAVPPSARTPRSMSRSSAAAAREMIRLTRGFGTGLPTALTIRGGRRIPPFAIAE